MRDRINLTKGWFAKADSDLANVRAMLLGAGPYDTACFHCQQAVEKYMKGFLAWRGLPFPFTHDLDLLGKLCDGADPSLNLQRPEVDDLTDYAVQLRYDNEFWPTQTEAADALAVAEQVRTAILERIPPSDS